MKSLIVIFLIGFCAILMIGCNDEQIDLVPVDEVDFDTLFHINSPSSDFVYFVGDPILFDARVMSVTLDWSQLSAIWESDKDGIINIDTTISYGNISFRKNNLSPNTHTITLRISYQGELIAINSVDIEVCIYKDLSRHKNKNDNNSVSFALTQSQINDFSNHKVYPYKKQEEFINGDIVATNKMAEDAIFHDTSVIIGRDYHSQVFVETSSVLLFASNEQSFFAGKYFTANNETQKKITHKDRNYIYAIDYEGSNFLFIDNNGFI